MPTRQETLLDGIDQANALGVEIGPLDKPLASKQAGTVFYVDHCDTVSLKARWASDPHVDVDALQVDAVWGVSSLRTALAGAMGLAADDDWPGVDYVVASHVIEHVPDLVTWLGEIHEVLKSTGRLRLAIPDKRYSFDFLRRTTSLTDVADAYVRQRRCAFAGARRRVQRQLPRRALLGFHAAVLRRIDGRDGGLRAAEFCLRLARAHATQHAGVLRRHEARGQPREGLAELGTSCQGAATP